MRKNLLILLAMILSLPASAVIPLNGVESSFTLAQNQRSIPRRPAPTRGGQAVNQNLHNALALARAGDYMPAAASLFSLARRPELSEERHQIRYILGLMLTELGLNQVAAFQFVDVVRAGNNRYTQQALEQLAFAADRLGDDTLLNYAMSRVRVRDFPSNARDMLEFRIGEVHMQNKNFRAASESFSNVPSASRYADQALYNRGLALAEMGDTAGAIRVFSSLLSRKAGADITDTGRVAAQMALARTYYQRQDWDRSIHMYRQIPRDHELWHDALFESSWAHLRSARFRSALSNFHSLHSSYYEDFYLPESLLLRSIVYLYICRYEEMEKVLGLFEQIYGPARRQVNDFLQTVRDPQDFYNELERSILAQRQMRAGQAEVTPLRLPYIVSRHILKQGDIQRSLAYLHTLQREKRVLDSMPPAWLDSPIGRYADRILSNRMTNTKAFLGDLYRDHLVRVRTELRDYYEQAGFIRYEMISGQREQIRQRIADQGLPSQQIDSQASRTFYIQNGFEYWPFRGEYWLDEIGNYHYLGTQACQ